MHREKQLKIMYNNAASLAIESQGRHVTPTKSRSEVYFYLIAFHLAPYEA